MVTSSETSIVILELEFKDTSLMGAFALSLSTKQATSMQVSTYARCLSVYQMQQLRSEYHLVLHSKFVYIDDWFDR